MISIRPPISNSSSPLTNPLETVPSAPTIIDITVNLMFHSFLSLPVYLPIFWGSFQVYQQKKINKESGRLRNQTMSRDYTDYSISKISQITEKSPRDLGTPAITKTIENTSANVGVKISKRNLT